MACGGLSVLIHEAENARLRFQYEAPGLKISDLLTAASERVDKNLWNWSCAVGQSMTAGALQPRRVGRVGAVFFCVNLDLGWVV